MSCVWDRTEGTEGFSSVFIGVVPMVSEGGYVSTLRVVRWAVQDGE